MSGFLGILAIAYLIWPSGKQIRDGSHDLGSNAIWLQHGWLGDDSWFERNQRETSLFRDDQKIKDLAAKLDRHNVSIVFPHLCPCTPNGRIAPVDEKQTERFLDYFADSDVIPWIGGVLGHQCAPDFASWRKSFVDSTVELLKAHPRLAGVQVNIEPLPSGREGFLLLLDELREAIPDGKILSVAAYPPPTKWQPSANVHWDQAYFREVASRVDQVAPMMYDTSITIPKFYEKLMEKWTLEILDWSGDADVLLGLAAYDDPGVGYHHAYVEDLNHGLAGVHKALSRFEVLPKNYRGIAIYCEWEMDDAEWAFLKREFQSKK